MQPRERRRAWRADIKRRKAIAAVVIPNDWVVEFAARNGRYERHLHTVRAVDAFREFAELEVRDGEKKRLLRNGKVIDREQAPREIHTAIGQEELPIAL